MSVPDAFYWLWQHTLGSVKFGIGTMVALAVYIAVGSGVPAVREYFELNEQAFFNAWPLWLLAVLLCSNLLVVTFERIPFTPPRYGVWSIHFGIVILVFGLVYYFKNKTEGLTLVRTGETVDWYYDSFERALYVKAGRRKAEPIPLPGLPRFETYAPQRHNDARLDRAGLRGLVPKILDYDPERRAGVPTPLHEILGLSGEEPIRLDVLAYYPYAVVGATYEQAPAAASGGKTGLKLTLRDPAADETRTQWIVADDPGQDQQRVGTILLRHIHRSDELTGEGLLQAAQTANEIAWSVGGANGRITIQPGERKPLGDTGYEIEAVEFLPSFPLFGSGEPVDTLELLVHPPPDSPHGMTFRRYVLNGRPTQTDFVLDAPGAGPKGARQDEPVDPGLVLSYTHADGLHLLPHGGETERHTLLTKADTPGLWQLVTRNAAPAELSYKPDGTLPIRIDGTLTDPHTGRPMPASLEMDIQRLDGIVRQEWVREVPPQQRDRRSGEAGVMQVVTVRLSRDGEWERILHVPFTQWPDQQPWTLGEVRIPGSDVPVHLQLSNTRRNIPAAVRLERFELVPYAGDFTPESMMRDFKSHLSLTNRSTGQHVQATAHMNSPVYFDARYAGLLGKLLPGESWLLYQNQWDPQEQAFTVLGVGNRPGVMTMTAGCVMIVLGLLWAFYVKPILIRQARERALREYAAGAGDRKGAKAQSRRNQESGALQGVLT